MNAPDRISHLLPHVFGVVLGANVLSMSVLNFTEASTKLTPIVYLLCMAVSWLLLRACRLTYPTLSPGELALGGILGLIFFTPRIPYLFEWALGYAVLPTGDDAFHIPNLASVIYTDRFPSRSTYDSSQYLAYYYAAWMPGAALYYTGIVSTVKQSLALIKLFYAFLLAYFPLYAAKVLLSEPRQRRTFLVLCYLYGGFDFLWWASRLDPTPTHSEWWAANLGFVVQYSNFVTLSLWTPQHLLTAFATLFALYVLNKSTTWIAAPMTGLLFASALFTSPFVTFGALPLVAWSGLRYRKLWAIPAAMLTFAPVSLPLWWIFFGNDSVGLTSFGALLGDWQQHKVAAFAAFLVVLLLELGPLLIAAGSAIRRQPWERWLFAMAALYLLSTFFIFYSENYSMRGSVMPIFTLVYLATPVILGWYERYRYRLLQAILATYLLGGLLEYASFTRMSWILLRQSDTAFNRAALRSNTDSTTLVPQSLVTEAGQHMLGWQVLEKKKMGRKQPMIIDELRQMHPDNAYRITYRALTQTHSG